MVLVDNKPVEGPHGWIWFHMATDDLTRDGLLELHAMASSLGLRRQWLHQHPGIPHYDVPLPKKAAAIRLGAVEVSPRELVKRCRRG